MILDTNALSAFAEGEQNIRGAIASHQGPYLPVIVLGEYRFGLMQVRDQARRVAWLQALTAAVDRAGDNGRDFRCLC